MTEESTVRPSFTTAAAVSSQEDSKAKMFMSITLSLFSVTQAAASALTRAAPDGASIRSAAKNCRRADSLRPRLLMPLGPPQNVRCFAGTGGLAAGGFKG